MAQIKQATWLTKKELADKLSVSTKTIQRWVASKKIPCHRISKQLLRFDHGKVLDSLGRFEIEEN